MIGRVVDAARRLVSSSTATGSVLGRPQRFFLLDASRALAAFAVLFWHYQHFYIPVGSHEATDFAARQPLHDVFGLFYDHGHYAVAIFWMISGFVFATVYLPARASTRSFAVNRFARLYPLHFLTLVVVALLQAIAVAKYGASLIYQHTDLYHFVLQLFFASGWGFERGFSYNAPIWSVSVEIIIYIFFWIIHRHLTRFGIVLPALLAAGFFALSLAFPNAAALPCGQYFFVGVALYIVHAALLRDRLLFALVVALALPIGFVGLYLDLLFIGLPGFFGSMLLLVVAAEDFVKPKDRALLGAIGDTTYGMYLWHVPVQLVLFLLLADTFDIGDLASSAWFLLLFIVLVVGVTRASFLWFERPMRDRLRKLGASRPAPDPSIAGP